MPVSMNDATATTPSPTTALRIRNWLVEHRVVISTIFFIALIAEDVLRGRLPHSWRDGNPVGLTGLGLVLAGLLVRSWAAGVLKKGRVLAETGPYSLCRHPLYLGSALMMFGFCILIGEGYNWLFICGPVAALYWMTIAKEETRISAQYPDRWPEYSAVTPRVIPWRPDLYKHAPWTPEIWLRNREYQALAGGLLGLAVVEMFHLR